VYGATAHSDKGKPAADYSGSADRVAAASSTLPRGAGRSTRWRPVH